MWAILIFAATIQMLGIVTLVMFKDVELAEHTEIGGIIAMIIGVLVFPVILIRRKLRK